jgi:hypothetical protein
MLHIALSDVQNALPLRKVYAFYWKYFPEMEGYRAMLWMEQPFLDADKCRYDKYVPQALAISKEHVLRLLEESLNLEFRDNATKGISRA